MNESTNKPHSEVYIAQTRSRIGESLPDDIEITFKLASGGKLKVGLNNSRTAVRVRECSMDLCQLRITPVASNVIELNTKAVEE